MLVNRDRALQRGVAFPDVVVEAARADGRQIAGLACLTWLKEPNLVDLRAVRVDRMAPTP